MSSIHKLGIIGIRSYDPEHEEIVKFFKPLTLILGKNGAGKTTIIEALKMAVCGSMPPNSQAGKTFIHDPKLTKRPEVKAKIEIAFTAINQRKILGVRTFQLTHTDKKTEFRQVDQILKAKDLNGDIISVTNKCAEMDRQIPELLGVSQAVLDNVIFCHQEEALWPFGDTAKLKSIFDELFDTTTYTNLLENLKKTKKEYKKMAKEALNEFQLEKKDFDILLRQNKGLLKDMEEIHDLQKEIENYQRRIKAIKDRMRPEEDKTELERNYNIIKYRITELQKKQEELREKFQAEDKEHFFESSVEQLKECKDDLLKNYAKKEQDLEVVDQKLEALRQDKDDLQRKLDDLSHADRDNSEINIKIRDCREKLKEYIAVNFVGNEGDERYNEKMYREASSQLEKMQKEREAEQRKYEEQDEAIDNHCNKVLTELSSARANKTHAEKELETLTLKLGTLQREIQDLKRKTQNRPKNSNQEIEQLTERIENLRESAGIYTQTIDLKTKELVEVSNQVSENMKNREISLRKTEYDELQEKFRAIEQEVESQSTEVYMLANSLKDIADIKISDDQSVDDLMKMVDDYELRLKDEKEAVIAKRDKYNDTLKEASSFINIKQTDIRNKQKEIKNFIKKMEEKQLSNILEGDVDYETQYQAIKEKLKQAEKRELAMQYTEDIMMKMFEKSQKSKKCAICSKKLEEAEIAKIGAKCQEMISKSSAFTGNEQKNLEDLREKKSFFKSVRDEYEEFRKTKEAYHQLEKEIQSKEKEKAIAEKHFNHIKGSIENYENIEGIIRDIRLASEKFQKAQDDETEVRNKINNLVQMYPALKEYRTSRIIVFDDKTLQEKVDAIKQEIDNCRTKITNFEDQIKGLQDRRNELEDMRGNGDRDFDNLERKTKEADELREKKIEYEDTVSKANEVINKLSVKQEEMDDKKKIIRNKRKEVEEKHSYKISKLKELVEEFYQLKNKWAATQKNKGRNKENDAQKERFKDQIQKIAVEIQSYQLTQQKYKEELREKDKNVKLIEDNIELQGTESELEKLLQDFEKVQSSYNETVENEKYNQSLKNEVEKETAKLNQLDGKYSVMINQYDRTLNDVKDKWSPTERAYIEKLFKANINESVVEDLDIYIENLEKSLMLFHKQKMEEINKIIADLWIKTYQGNDIRKIEIKSDIEPSSRNKSFNYRITFANQEGKELDMKGRCSMGQKVIASIVIRMALAEAFCTNCGILALDEPTTNLDKDHIKKLAKELSNLIEDRANNENFQLIIITHDKEFLRELRDYADEYYKVSKDARSYSRIERNRTSNL